MAARLRIGFVALLALAITACAPASSGQQGGQPPTPRVTPQSSFSPQIEGTVALLRSALAARAMRLDPPIVPYRSGEPAALASVPRAVLQIDVGDPSGGYVVIYELPDGGTAATRGAEFADYLESGFGQTNYPLDAQFSLTQVGGTIVFTWWSAERAADRARAQAAFEAVGSVGQEIPIVK